MNEGYYEADRYRCVDSKKEGHVTTTINIGEEDVLEDIISEW